MSDQHHPGPDGAPDPYGQQPYPSSPYGPDGQAYAADPYGAQHQPYAAQQPYGAPYGQPAYAQPVGYGVDASGWSDKSRTTAGLLSLLLPLVGVCGVGRLYAGQIGLGLAQLLGFFLGCFLMVVLIGFVIAPVIWVWSVVDGIVLLASGGRDAYGRALR